MKNHLDHAIPLRQSDRFGPHIDQTESELPPESGIDETAADEEAAPRIGGAAAQGGGEIGGDLNAFEARDERTLSRRERDVAFCPEIIGGGLERGLGERGDDQSAPLFGRHQAGPDLSRRKDHITI